MPNLDHENIGDVAKSKYLKGTIVSTDGDDDTAVVSVPGFGNVPAILFYHCTADAVERENGALEDAAGAFSEDDEVIVLKQADGSFKIIGFADGVKRECAQLWKFIFTADGVEVGMDTTAGAQAIINAVTNFGNGYPYQAFPDLTIVSGVPRDPAFTRFRIDLDITNIDVDFRTISTIDTFTPTGAPPGVYNSETKVISFSPFFGIVEDRFTIEIRMNITETFFENIDPETTFERDVGLSGALITDLNGGALVSIGPVIPFAVSS